MNNCGLRIADCGLDTTHSHANCVSARMVLNPKSAIRNPQSRGFTLLEVMVAVAILSMVLVTLIGLKNQSSRDVLLAEHMTTATLLAKQKMTEALLTRVVLPEEKEGEFEDEAFKGYLWKKTVAVTPLPAVMEVRVAVLWKEGDRDEMVELVSYE